MYWQQTLMFCMGVAKRILICIYITSKPSITVCVKYTYHQSCSSVYRFGDPGTFNAVDGQMLVWRWFNPLLPPPPLPTGWGHG